MVRAGQANLPGNKQKIQMTHNPSGRTLSPAMALAFALAGGFVMLMHMYAFGLYALCVAGHELALLLEDRPLRTALRRRFSALAGVALMLVLPASLLLLGPASGAANMIVWSNLQFKVEALAAPIFFSQPYLELPLLAAIAILLLGGFALGAISINRRIVPTVVLLALVLLLMPRMLFGSYYADFRLLSCKETNVLTLTVDLLNNAN